MELIIDKPIDSGGFFINIGGKCLVFAKGKHKNSMPDQAPSYLKWMMKQESIPEDTKEIIRNNFNKYINEPDY